VFREALHPWLAERRFAQRAAGAVVRRHARRQLVEFDRRDCVRSQSRILRGLVHRARATLFGREHDFQRIRTPADFRRLVPLRISVESLADSGAADRECHRQAALTALALADLARPNGRPDATSVVVRVADGALVSWLDASLPFYLRPLVRFAAEGGSIADSDMSLGPAIALGSLWHGHGPIGLEDPRRGRLRLLTDHGVFFEFVPAEELGKERPSRYGLGEVELGAIYVVALTTTAGAWACLTDITIAFERRNPPLLCRVPSTRRPVTIQPPHRQIAGTPAVRLEMIGHSPWSIPVDRG
jgi:hypothetical protein